MKLKKKILSVVAIVATFTFTFSAVLAPVASAGVQSVSAIEVVPVSSELVEVTVVEQLPDFIPDGAIPMTEAEMAEVRGELVWFGDPPTKLCLMPKQLR